ncbi:hypothetical protein HZS_6847 [Henneguya salminicola]|nr:hypothetical protein HZS_6847 [Henneguya salminicola]
MHMFKRIVAYLSGRLCFHSRRLNIFFLFTFLFLFLINLYYSINILQNNSIKDHVKSNSPPFNVRNNYNPRKIVHSNPMHINYLKNKGENINSTTLRVWKKIYNTQKENMYFLIGRKHSLPDYNNINLSQTFPNNVFKDIIDLNLYQLRNLEELRQNFNNIESWQKLTEFVENVIVYNQNPPNCATDSVFSCKASKSCGFACQIHHLLFCLTVGLAHGKPVIVEDNSWHDFKSITDVFLPLSQTCDKNKNVKITQIPIIEAFQTKPFLPTAVPLEIYENILNFHTSPFLWWIGQLTKYILRFQPKTTEYISRRQNLVHPIVGVHIRRTDKIGVEANLYQLEEYMFWVELYFKKLEIKGDKFKRRVYLATDEPKLGELLKESYSNYEFIHNEDFSISANTNRASQEGTYGILSDTYYLSLTDYLVCTFSSQVICQKSILFILSSRITTFNI